MTSQLVVGEQLDERALVARVACGDEGAVEYLYRAFADAVFAFIVRRVGNSREDAEDLTLDTFLSASHASGTFQGKCAVRTWLCAIAKQKVADFLRRAGAQKRDQASLSVDEVAGLFRSTGSAWGSADVDTILDRLEAKVLAQALLDELREDEREAVLLRYYDEFSVRDISQIMGRSEKGVESLLGRAKRRQRAALAGWMRAGLTNGGAA